jgi:hypothetical protein
MRQQTTEIGRQNSKGPFGLSLFRRRSSDLPPPSSVEIAAQDRHLEVIRPLVVFVVDEQHADEFVADIDLGGIVLLRPRHDADARVAEQLLEVGVEFLDFLYVSCFCCATRGSADESNPFVQISS